MSSDGAEFGERIISAAQRHGDDSGSAYQIGDLEAVVREMADMLITNQLKALLEDDGSSVSEILDMWENTES